MTISNKTLLTLLFLIVIVFVFSSFKKQNNETVIPNTVATTTANTTATTTEEKNSAEIEAIRNRPFPLAGMNDLNSNGTSTASSSAIKMNGIISGTVLLGPMCPVMRDPPDPACADKPHKTNLVLIKKGTEQVVKEFSSDEDGKFKIEVKTGEYTIQNTPFSAMLPRCSSSNIIKVSVSVITQVDVSCDTGIR